MNRHFVCISLTLAFSPICSGQYDGPIARVKDAPFSAEVRGWSTSRDSSGTWAEEIGRAASGSIYYASIDPADETNSRVKATSIHDAPSNCNVSIGPYRALTKGVTSRGTDGLSINLGIDAVSAWPTRTIEDIRKGNFQEQEIYRRTPQTSDSDGENHRTALGKKVADGTAIFGSRYERTHDSKTESVEERWESELGFRYSESRSNTNQPSSWGYRATSLKKVEPPADRFALQGKVFSPTRALIDAKTLFVPEFHSQEKLRQQIESILTSSGRFTIVPSADVADLVIRFETSAIQNGTEPLTYFSMSFREPGSHEQYLGDVLMISIHFKGNLDGSAQAPVVSTCFANLWQQVENLQPPQDSPGKKF
jgi:hypothetical protein